VFQGVAATGRQTEIMGIAIRRIADGKIAEEWVINDQPGLMKQFSIFHLPDRANRQASFTNRLTCHPNAVY
jgi:hypothetical protein